MKQTLTHLSLVTLFATMLALSLAPSLPAEEDRGCTNATLRGPYVEKSTIWNFVRQQHAASLGVITFDGRGSFSGTLTNVNQNGVQHFTPRGTYTVNPDCTGSGLTEDGIAFDIVILDGGNEVEEIVTNTTNRVQTLTLKKQFPRHRDDDEN